MAREPLAYLLTFSTYGSWLQGRSPGWVDRQHNQYGSQIPAPDVAREREHRARMAQPIYLLDAPRRVIVVRTIREVASHRAWRLWATHARSNHVHTLITAAAKPEKVSVDLKSWASRRLREALVESAERNRWSEHGSHKYLWTEEAVEKALHYVVHGQGAFMAAYDYRAAELLLGAAEAKFAAELDKGM